ncbi:MAG: elongation factor P maturation arginine rhamnosyltransferase EarP [Burkholderiaceae bacterium]
MDWDVYCRVVDNHGDLGVSWRLSADLAARGERVRLWVDDASALAWMAPHGAPGVSVHPWPDASGSAAAEPADVVIAAFGCELPRPVLAGMAAAGRAPVWINLEYLSAESYVERSHRLPSLQSTGPAAGLTQWFFYPGYSDATGGLLREPDLTVRQRTFDRSAWLESAGIALIGRERIVSLFCYAPQPSFGALLRTLEADDVAVPTLLLAAPGAATELLREHLGLGLARGRLRGVAMPWLSQVDHDHLLWASDLNVVRGEDSWIRAQWAGRPFLWQAYAQHDEAHAAKVDAFMDRFLSDAPADLAIALRALSAGWNGLRAGPLGLPPAGPWQAHCQRWRDALVRQPDLTTQLVGFAAARR